jgi:hypothetical protein
MQALSSNTISQQDRHSLHPGLASSHYDNASLANSSPLFSHPATLNTALFSAGEQCTMGALLAPARVGGERRGGGRHRQAVGGREAYYTRELATDHQQYLSGHGESPGRWYGAGATTLRLQGEASPGGFQAMFEGRDPTTGELLGRLHGRNGVPAFDVVLRPTKSVSVLYGLGDPATGRAVLAAHHAGLAEAVGYLDGHLGARRGHGGHEHVSGQGLLAVGFDTGRLGRAIRCCTPTWWWPTGSGGRTVAGRPWTAATCTAIGWLRTPSTGPPTNGNLSGHWGWSGRRRAATATASFRGCPRSWFAASPNAPTRSTSN